MSNAPNAEGAVQEALIAAATRWPLDGRPDNPLGWLIRVASRRMATSFAAATHAVAAKTSPPRGRSRIRTQRRAATTR